MPLQTSFNTFLRDEVAKVKGLYYPVHASLLQQILIRHVPIQNLHPNPDDEFCFPSIGPNYSIISEYERQFREEKSRVYSGEPIHTGVREPIIVQKTMPDGYMILNGHHRWAAALKSNQKKMFIRIVNVTQEQDIRHMVEQGRSDTRVTLDLDEVVFCANDDSCQEKPLSFPAKLFFRENVRKGIPALLHFLNEKEYDVWVYSARYYSMDYIRSFFKARQVRLAGIVTGAGRKELSGKDDGKELKKLIEKKYRQTIAIDSEAVLRIDNAARNFEEIPVDGPADEWSLRVMNAIREMTKDA